MLLAVEGGGFFSSSASGYSKGLTLLLLGQKDEDKRVKVLPWNHYQLVDQKPEKSSSKKKWRLSKTWLTFVSLGCASAGVNASSPHTSIEAQPRDSITSDHEEDSNIERAAPKSNLKRRTNAAAVPENAHERKALVENVSDISGHDVGRRKVQWTDAAGTELVEIREFEPSEMGESGDELESKDLRNCSCTIM